MCRNYHGVFSTVQSGVLLTKVRRINLIFARIVSFCPKMRVASRLLKHVPLIKFVGGPHKAESKLRLFALRFMVLVC